MKITFQTIRCILLAAVSLAVTSSAMAATVVTWNPPVNMSGDADVKNVGQFLYAYNFGSPNDTTVNGITFTSFNIAGGLGASVTKGNVTLAPEDNTHLVTNYNNPTPVGSPFTSLSPEYQALLGAFSYTLQNNGGDLKITLGGLTVGETYQVQFWLTDVRNGNGGTFNNTKLQILSGSSLSDSISLKVNNDANNLGQYIIGTFIADSTSQLFTLQSQTVAGGVRTFSRINALSVQVIPEPGAMALCGIAALGGLVWRRVRH